MSFCFTPLLSLRMMICPKEPLPILIRTYLKKPSEIILPNGFGHTIVGNIKDPQLTVNSPQLSVHSLLLTVNSPEFPLWGGAARTVRSDRRCGAIKAFRSYSNSQLPNDESLGGLLRDRTHWRFRRSWARRASSCKSGSNVANG